MRYLSLFSGIEACSVAWAPLGWECVAVAEIEPWPSRALAHHYPDVPNLGDVTKITEEQIAALGRIDVVVFGSPCFTAGHTVLTERGLVPIENVVVGDMVWTHASRWRRVSNTMQRVAPTVVVNGQGHNSIRATPDHPFYAADTVKIWNGNGYSRTVGAAEWVHAEKMAGKRWATPHNLSSDQGVPDVLNTLDGAYLAGLYLGDGHIVRTAGRKKKSVILSVNDTKKAKILPGLRRAWGTISDISHDRSVTRLQLSRTEVADTLAENFKEYSHGKTIPVWALTADRDWQESLLQGVIDTDGSPVKNGWRVTTVSRTLAVGLRLLATRLGYSTSLHFSARPETCVIEGRTVNQRDTWTVFMRKAERSSELRTDEHTWGLVRSATPAGDAQVYDITVEDDHSFICDGIVVHNCQDLSVAGKRKGLDGARSGLFFTAMQIVGWARQWCDCRFALWENVPGAFSSNKGRDFAAVVDAMAGLEGTGVPPKGWGTEGCALGAQAMVEWSTLDAQWFGVAQRRRRVFALADFGDWRNRPPILLEPESLRGNSAPPRETGEDVAGTLASRTRGGGFPGSDEACSGYVRPVLTSSTGEVSHCLNAGGMRRIDYETETMIACTYAVRTAQTGANGIGVARDVSHTLDLASGQAVCVIPFDTTQITSAANYSNPLAAVAHTPTIAFNSNAQPDEMKFDEHVSAPLTCSQYSAVAFQSSQSGVRLSDVHATLDAGAHPPSVVFTLQHAQIGRIDSAGPQGKGWQQDVAFTQDSRTSADAVVYGTRVRRLTPRECEKLQGFPAVSEKITIEACLDHQNQSVRAVLKCLRWQNSVLSVEENGLTQFAKTAVALSNINQACHVPLAALHVRMHSVDELLAIRSAGRLIWSANGAGQSKKSLPPTLTESSVKELARLLREVARTITAGRGVSQQSISLSFPASSGATSAEKSGLETKESASVVASDQSKATFTTSDLGLITMCSDSTAGTLCCSVLHAIAGCIPSTTLPETFSIELTLETPYTAVPDARGKPSADGPRYKALGNSMAVPVMRWIGQQIDYAMIWSTP